MMLAKTTLIGSILDVADHYDAIVLDQWGVLHNGHVPYPAALETLAQLGGRRLGMLSNSGKRAAPNADRIAAMGFDAAQFHTVMTSGEALWRHFHHGDARHATAYPIEGNDGDAQQWAQGLDLKIVDDVRSAEAVLLMGLPDGTQDAEYDAQLQDAAARGLPLYCSNPDLTSPRAHGTYVMSPGVLAQSYAALGGSVHLFGKPHMPIFHAMQTTLGCSPNCILMVGDSVHHDIRGAQDAGWDSLLIEAGVHAPEIGPDRAADIARLAQAAGATPTYSLTDLR